MQLHAVSFDPEMANAEFSGEVSRVFEHACHIRTASGDAIFIVAEGLDCGPQAIRISTPVQFSFATSLLPGTSVIGYAGHILFEDHKLDIDLSRAVPWSSRPLPWPGRLSAAALNILYERLTGRAEVTPWDDHPGLNEATSNLDVQAAIGILASRVGLGPGLTPAGDDYIVGYLLGLHTTETGPVRRTQFRKQISGWLADQGHRTSDVSAAFFRAACDGRFTGNLVELAHAASRGDKSDIISTASNVLAQGASSGYCTLSGFTDAAFSWSH